MRPSSTDPEPTGQAGSGDRVDGESPAVHLPEGAIPIGGDELCRHPVFADVRPKDVDKLIARHKIRKHQPPIWLRRLEPGAVICREGEYGSTAFFVARGSVDVGISSTSGPDRRARTGGGVRGLARRIADAVIPSRQFARRESPRPGFIAIDAPVSLPYDRPVAVIHEGELFGEMSCMSSVPRSATCVAGKGGAECIEMLRSVLEFLKKRSKSFQERIERTYREHTLDAHMRSVPLFAELPEEFLDHLRARVEFVPFEPEGTLCLQGEPADAFYLIRLGYVAVSQQRPGGQVVLRYLGPGQSLGEVGLLVGGVRTATCKALDHVEVVVERSRHGES